MKRLRCSGGRVGSTCAVDRGPLVFGFLDDLVLEVIRKHIYVSNSAIEQNTQSWPRNMYKEHTFETEVDFAMYIMYLFFPSYVSLCT